MRFENPLKRVERLKRVKNMPGPRRMTVCHPASS